MQVAIKLRSLLVEMDRFDDLVREAARIYDEKDMMFERAVVVSQNLLMCSLQD